MHIELLSSSGLIKEFKVVVPSDTINTHKNDYIKARAHKVKVDGFRPGKVPLAILEQRLGGDALNHALRTMLDEAIKTTVKDNNLQYINDPNADFEEFREGKDLCFKLTFETLPEFEIKDFSSISLEKLTVSIPDTEIQKALDNLFEKHHVIFEKTKENRGVKSGDRVDCLISVKLNGKKVAGHQDQKVEVIIGSSDSFFVPNIEEILLSMKEGQEETFTATVRENYSDKAIAGKNVEVIVHIDAILEPKTLEKNDEFAEQFGKNTLEELKEAVKKDLENNYNTIAHLYLKRHLLDALDSAYIFDLPESMVEGEFNVIWKHLQDELIEAKEQGEEDEVAGKSEEELREEYKKIAERRVRLGLIISKVAKENKIQLTSDEISDAVFKEAIRHRSQVEKVLQYYRNHPAAVDRLVAPLLEEKTVDFIAAQTNLTENVVDIDTLREKTKNIMPVLFDL